MLNCAFSFRLRATAFLIIALLAALRAVHGTSTAAGPTRGRPPYHGAPAAALPCVAGRGAQARRRGLRRTLELVVDVSCLIIHIRWRFVFGEEWNPQLPSCCSLPVWIRSWIGAEFRMRNRCRQAVRIQRASPTELPSSATSAMRVWGQRTFACWRRSNRHRSKLHWRLGN